MPSLFVFLNHTPFLSLSISLALSHTRRSGCMPLPFRPPPAGSLLLPTPSSLRHREWRNYGVRAIEFEGRGAESVRVYGWQSMRGFRGDTACVLTALARDVSGWAERTGSGSESMFFSSGILSLSRSTLLVFACFLSVLYFSRTLFVGRLDYQTLPPS